MWRDVTTVLGLHQQIHLEALWQILVIHTWNTADSFNGMTIDMWHGMTRLSSIAPAYRKIWQLATMISSLIPYPCCFRQVTLEFLHPVLERREHEGLSRTHSTQGPAETLWDLTSRLQSSSSKCSPPCFRAMCWKCLYSLLVLCLKASEAVKAWDGRSMSSETKDIPSGELT